MIIGYKCFNEDLTNNYGFQFEVGGKYSVSGVISAGTRGNGYHMCKNIEDTFRFYGGIENSNIVVCEVIGSGDMVSFSDEYYGYYDMYSVEKIEIIRKIDRSEIIQMALNFDEMRVTRLIQTFKLNPSEIELFECKFAEYSSIQKAIAYYQKRILDVYNYCGIEHSKRKIYRK